jgi:glucokinase
MPESGPGPRRPALAVDIGGTKLAAALVDRSGRIAHQHRVATPTRGADPDAVWRALTGLLDGVRAAASNAGEPRPYGIGVGCGGPMRWPDGLVSPLNIPAWRDFPLRDKLGAFADGEPVRIHNDAICTAVGEHWRGAGRGVSDVLGMVVSTGVGGGLVLGGKVVDGASGNAGHIGHVVVDPAGPPCACGGRGCLEAVASGPSTAAWATAQGWRSAAGVDAATLTRDARRGHPIACAALERAGRALGVAIASAAALCDVEVVAIGGGLAQAGPLLFDPLQQALRTHARLDFARDVRVVPAALGQQAGLVGAAGLLLGGPAYWSAG